MFRGKSVSQQLADMFNEDMFPVEGSDLYVDISCNPNLLRSELPDIVCQDSLTFALLNEGCLNCVERISGFDNADIFYCGQILEGLSILLSSSGVNVYLALKYLEQMTTGSEDYYQSLYRREGDGRDFHAELIVSKPEDWNDIVIWFSEKAAEINALRLTMDTENTPENKLRLAKRYLIIALMEEASENAARYFYQYACMYLLQALPDCEIPPLDFSCTPSETLRSLEDWKKKYTKAERSIAELFDGYNMQLSSRTSENVVTNNVTLDYPGLRQRSQANALAAGYASQSIVTANANYIPGSSAR